jgi:hypothetical protein
MVDHATALLHFDGANGSTTVVDSSGNGFTFVLYGTGYNDTSQKKFGTASFYLDANGSRIQGNGAAGLNFGVGDFTVDFWFRQNGSQGQNNLFAWGGAKQCVTSKHRHLFNYFVPYGDAITGTSQTITPDVWHHIAITRASGVTYLFFDGNLRSAADTQNYINGATGDRRANIKARR